MTESDRLRRRWLVRAGAVVVAVVVGVVVYSFGGPVGEPHWSVFDRPASPEDEPFSESWQTLDDMGVEWEARRAFVSEHLEVFVTRHPYTGKMCLADDVVGADFKGMGCTTVKDTPYYHNAGTSAGVSYGGFNYSFVVVPDGWPRVSVGSATCRVRNNVVVVRDAPSNSEVRLHRGVRTVVALAEREPRDPEGVGGPGEMPGSLYDGTPECVYSER